MFVSLRRSAYAVTGSKLPTAEAQRPLHKSLPAFRYLPTKSETVLINDNHAPLKPIINAGLASFFLKIYERVMS
ncbi:MAG: hypothetical protein GX262_11220 [Clostridia bacterium]|jgi:hypothetical protein|nr:hypothetical protein [Clostridia bacterium]